MSSASSKQGAGASWMADVTSRRSAILGTVAAAVGGGVVGATVQDTPVQARLTSVRKFGVVGDGTADDTRAAQAAYDELARSGGGILYFPRGKYRLELQLSSRDVHLCGEGRGATQLRQVDPARPVLRAIFGDASWDTVRVFDLALAGVGRREGVGFTCGLGTGRGHDEYVGRVQLDRVGFENFDKAIERPYGNIGFYLDACTFNQSNFHLWSTSNSRRGDPMHSGILTAMRCRFSGFDNAMCYVRSENTPGGQIVFSDCVIEQGSGFAFYLDRFNGAAPVPAIQVLRTWNEATATGRDINIEGSRHAEARFLLARDCSVPIHFEDTPLGSIELVNSVVQTRNCSLDAMTPVLLDSRSQLRHQEARLYTGMTAGICSSIAGPEVAEGLSTPWFTMPLPYGTTSAYSANRLQSFDGSAPIDFFGTVSARTQPLKGEAALPGRDQSQLLEIASGSNLWPAQFVHVRAGQWLVILYIYRHLAGGALAIQINGSQGLSGQALCRADEWNLVVNISSVGGRDIDRVGILHTAPQGPAKILLGGMSFMTFDDRQKAIAFANARLFPV